MTKVLFVGRDAGFLLLCKQSLEAVSEYTVEITTSPDDALRLLESREFEALVSDLDLPGEGLDFLNRTKEEGVELPRIVLTPGESQDAIGYAIEGGADCVVRKTDLPQSMCVRLANMLPSVIDRIRVELSLKESEQKYRSFVQNLKGIAYSTEIGVFTPDLFEGMVKEITGYEPQDFLERRVSWDSLVHPDDIELVMGASERMAEKPGFVADTVYRIVDRQGETRYVNDVAHCVPEAGMGNLKVQGLVYDVTEKWRAIESLTASEARLRAIMQSTGDIVFTLDREHRFTAVYSRQMERLGTALTDFIGKAISEVFDEKSGAVHSEASHRALQGELVVYEWDLVDDRGKTTFYQNSMAPLRDENEEILGVVGICRDITELRDVEDLATQLGRVLDQSVNEVYIYDPESLKFIQANQGALENTGYTIEEMHGITPVELKPYFSEEAYRRIIQPLLDGTKEQVVFETFQRRKDGSQYEVEVRLQLMQTDRRKVMVAIILDITERKRMQEALRIASKKLELMGKVTRHDLLNQLQVVEGYLDLCRISGEAKPEYLEKIARASEKMRVLLNMQKLYEELGSKEERWIRVGDMIGALWGEVHLDEVIMDIRCDSVEILADASFERAFFNLIQNSLRHGGEVTRIVVTCRPSDDRMLLTFKDDGRGIPPEEKELIFKYGYGKGMGHGLFLVREILETDGMSIEEVGTYGEGAIFDISVPNNRWRIITEG